jgi:N-acyl-D-amino-acid deacylase
MPHRHDVARAISDLRADENRPAAAAQPSPTVGSADVIIRGGTIVDGTGAPSYIADVAIRGERIAAIGKLCRWKAPLRLEAKGLHVAPGFIDAHSHACQGLADPMRGKACSQLAQGITTVAINPDGFGPVELKSQREAIEQAGPGVNVIQLIGHGSVRHAVMGERNSAPTSDELEAMKKLVHEAMEAGAFGMSSGLFYTPGRFADTAELIELARIVARYDGVHSSHIRDESDYSIGVLAAVEELIQISRESGVAGVVTHIKTMGPGGWGKAGTICETISRARAEGIEVWADQYPYDASSTGMIAALVPAWARAAGEGGLLGRLQNPQIAALIRREMLENLSRRGGPERLVFRSPQSVAGMSLRDHAARCRLHPVDAAIALIAEGTTPSIISFNTHDDDVCLFMQQDFTVTSSDGGLPAMGQGIVHPRTYGAFPRKLGKYARERGVLDLTAAIRSMTGLTARVFRLADRGILRENMMADVAVFDLERVNDPATFDDPHRYAEGMVHVLVNGKPAIVDADFTDARAGRVLRHNPRDCGCKTDDFSTRG